MKPGPRYPIALFLTVLFATACDQPARHTESAQVADPESTTASTPAQDEDDAYGRQLGTVEFPVSCNEAATLRMQRSLALLHHMTYTGAELEFSNAAKADPECALAYWGMAMSWVHPLWNDPPSPDRLSRGLELLRKAEAMDGKTQREAGYIAAALAYYDGADSRPEPESLVLFRDAWEDVYREYPDDVEAASFFALGLMAAADKSDVTFSAQARAGLVVEDVLTKVPDHPAGHHYVIHAYDSPDFAEQALQVARQYSDVAPEVPHALHMPTHIFTRLGYWDDSIAMNERSSVAAEASTGGAYASSQMLHADDYLVYANLQRAREAEALAVTEKDLALEGPWDKNARGAAAYALAAMPARLALERRDWAAAAANQARVPTTFPWSEAYAQFEAIAWFGRGLGAARAGEETVAAEAVLELRNIEAALEDRRQGYWARQVEIQALSIEAWMAYMAGDQTDGLSIMQAAAELENSTDKHPITPGEILPANELYGDMLLETGEAEAAIAAYRASLARSPNRFNSLFGVAASALALDDEETAAAYFGHLVELTEGSEADWPRLQVAREFMATVINLSAGP
jgi:hypothetical protein